MKHPFVILALVFCSGIFFVNFIKIPFGLIYSLVVVLLIFSSLLIRRGLVFNVFISCLVFTLGAALLKNSKESPRCHISKYIYYRHDQPYIIKGLVNSAPQARANKAYFIFKTQAIQVGNLNHSCCGNILVYLKSKKDLRYGDELVLCGIVYRPFNFKGPNRQSYRDYLYNQGIWFIMSVKTDADVVRLNKNSGFIIKGFALSLKNKMEEMLFRHTTPLTAAILDAMILGEKKNIPWFVNNAMMKSGTLHILVVSGFNVSIVTLIIVLLLKLIRLPRKLRLILTIPLLILYCLVTGASTPVVRATVMGIVFIVSFLVKREPDIYNSLAVAALFILVSNPRQLFDIGFQLSFASVIAIVYLYPKVKSLLQIEFLKIKYLRLLCSSCLVSFSAWVGTLGFIAYYFKIFSPITVVANIFIVPLATLITLCGFSLILMGLIFSPIVPFFASTSELVVVLLLKINTFLVKLPAAYFLLP